MKPRYLLVLLLMTYAGWAQAAIYKYVDAHGHVTYSSTPMPGSRKLNLEPLPTMDSPRDFPQPHTESESAFPRVNSETQHKRDNTRRQILENELAAEQKLLDQAKQKLQLAQDTPEVYHTKSGHTFRNVAKFQANVTAAQDQVTLHEKNIQAIRTELSRLK